MFLSEEQISGTKKKKEKKKKISVKLHRQFVYPSSDKLIGLLKESDANGEGLNDIIKYINFEFDICMRYRKAKPKPIVALMRSSLWT